MIKIKNTGIYYTDPKNTKAVVRLTIKNSIGPFFEPSYSVNILPLTVEDVAKIFPKSTLEDAVSASVNLLKLQIKGENIDVTDTINVLNKKDSTIFQSIAAMFERDEIIELLHIAYHTAWQNLNGGAQLPEYVQRY